jgi:hypothetical protein
MKYLLTAVLFLSTSVGFGQEATLDPLPAATSDEIDELLTAPAVEETPIAAEEVVTPETAPVVTEEEIPALDAAPVLDPSPVVSEEPQAVPVVEEVKVAQEVKPLPKTESKAEIEDEGDFKHRKSHWITTFGFETTKYELPLEFNGARKSFGETDRELYGGRLGVGREFYLGWGFLFQGRVEGYYMGTLFEGIKTADPEFSTEVSNQKDTGSIYGAEAVAHFGWMFDYKTKNPFLGEMTYLAMELFVEAGVGRGKSYQRKEYKFDASVVDYYDFLMEDEFTNTSVSAGVNFLSTSTGYFLYLRATQSALAIDKRKGRIKSIEGAGSGTSTDGVAGVKFSEKDPDVDPITVFAIGGGYKF